MKVQNNFFIIVFFKLVYVYKKRRRPSPYASEVHHKPEHNTEKPTPKRLAQSMFGLLSLFEVVISKAIEQICLHSCGNRTALA